MRSILTVAIISLIFPLSACKKDGDSESPGLMDGVTKDVNSEVDNAGESWDNAVDDVNGAGSDISDAVSDDDDDGDGEADGEADDEADDEADASEAS